MFAHLTEILHQFYGELTYSGPERSVRTGDRRSGVCPAAVVQERTREPDVCCASMVRLSTVEMLTCPTGTTSARKATDGIAPKLRGLLTREVRDHQPR